MNQDLQDYLKYLRYQNNSKFLFFIICIFSTVLGFSVYFAAKNIFEFEFNGLILVCNMTVKFFAEIFTLVGFSAFDIFTSLCELHSHKAYRQPLKFIIMFLLMALFLFVGIGNAYQIDNNIDINNESKMPGIGEEVSKDKVVFLEGQVYVDTYIIGMDNKDEAPAGYRIIDILANDTNYSSIVAHPIFSLARVVFKIDFKDYLYILEPIYGANQNQSQNSVNVKILEKLLITGDGSEVIHETPSKQTLKLTAGQDAPIEWIYYPYKDNKFEITENIESLHVKWRDDDKEIPSDRQLVFMDNFIERGSFVLNADNLYDVLTTGDISVGEVPKFSDSDLKVTIEDVVDGCANDNNPTLPITFTTQYEHILFHVESNTIDKSFYLNVIGDRYSIRVINSDEDKSEDTVIICNVKINE